MASARRHNNTISKIKDANGVWKEQVEDVKQVIVDYFYELSQTSTTHDMLKYGEVTQTVHENLNQDLMLPITSEEVKSAVFAMHPEKSPVLDGLHPTFFQAYYDIVNYDIVGDDVSDFYERLFDTGVLPNGINYTLVCHIPKVKEPKQMKDVCPISLCNVLMQILSKIMANRLNRVCH